MSQVLLTQTIYCTNCCVLEVTCNVFHLRCFTQEQVKILLAKSLLTICDMLICMNYLKYEQLLV